jgi:hypothetical protein
MAGLQEQIDDLVRQMVTNRSDIEALEDRAQEAERRAARFEARADASEARAQIDRDMIAELQRDGVVSQEHAAQLEHALRSSRVVGAAIGLIMSSRQVAEEDAFRILRSASNDSNRKVRDLAAELVDSANKIDATS